MRGPCRFPYDKQFFREQVEYWPDERARSASRANEAIRQINASRLFCFFYSMSIV